MTSKDAWELAWESNHPARAQLLADTRIADKYRNELITHRDLFCAGYHAALAQQEQAIRAAKREALEEVADRLRGYFRRNPQNEWTQILPGSLRELIAKYSDSTKVEPHDP